MSVPLQDRLRHGQLRCRSILTNVRTKEVYQCVRGLCDPKFDPHTICSWCRRRSRNGRPCSQDDPCSECGSWPPAQWELFKSRDSYRKRQEKRRKRRVGESSGGDLTKGKSSGKRRKDSGASSSKQGEQSSVPSHTLSDTDSSSAGSVSHIESEEGFAGFDEDIIVDVSHALSVLRSHSSPSPDGSSASRFSGVSGSGGQVPEPGALASSLICVPATPPLPVPVVASPAVAPAAPLVSGLAPGASSSGVPGSTPEMQQIFQALAAITARLDAADVARGRASSSDAPLSGVPSGGRPLPSDPALSVSEVEVCSGGGSVPAVDGETSDSSSGEDGSSALSEEDTPVVTSWSKGNPDQVFVPDAGVDEKPLLIQLDNGHVVFFWKGDHTVRVSSAPFQARGVRPSKSFRIRVKFQKEFAMLETPRFCAYLRGRRFPVVHVMTLYRDFVHGLPGSKDFIRGLTSGPLPPLVDDDEVEVVASFPAAPPVSDLSVFATPLSGSAGVGFRDSASRSAGKHVVSAPSSSVPGFSGSRPSFSGNVALPSASSALSSGSFSGIQCPGVASSSETLPSGSLSSGNPRLSSGNPRLSSGISGLVSGVSMSSGTVSAGVLAAGNPPAAGTRPAGVLAAGNHPSAGAAAGFPAAVVTSSSEHAKILALEAEVAELKAMMSSKDSVSSSEDSVEDKEAAARLVSAWKVLKPYLETYHPEALRAVPARWVPDKTRARLPASASDKSELVWSTQVADVLAHMRSLVRGTRDVKGRLVKSAAKPLTSGSYVPHILPNTLRRFYRTAADKPELGIQARPHFDAKALRQLSSTFAPSVSRVLLTNLWDCARMSLEIASYLDILDTVFRSCEGGSVYEGLPAVAKAAMDSMQQAISHLHMTSAVGMVNGLLHKRDEALNRLGGRLSDTAKQTLRECAFTADEVLDSDAFSDAIVSSRLLAKDKRVLPTASRLSSVDSSSSAAPASAASSSSKGKKKKKSKRGASGAGAGASGVSAGAGSSSARRGGHNFRGASSRGHASRGRGRGASGKSSGQ